MADRKPTKDMTPAERREYGLRCLADMSPAERAEMQRLYGRGPSKKLVDDSCDCPYSTEPPRTCLAGCPALRSERDECDYGAQAVGADRDYRRTSAVPRRSPEEHDEGRWSKFVRDLNGGS